MNFGEIRIFNRRFVGPDPTVRAQFVSLGAMPRPTTSADLVVLTRATRAKMVKLIAEAGIKSD